MAGLWEDPPRRRSEGDAMIARLRERFGEDRFTGELRRVYGSLSGP